MCPAAAHLVICDVSKITVQDVHIVVPRAAAAIVEQVVSNKPHDELQPQPHSVAFTLMSSQGTAFDPMLQKFVAYSVSPKHPPLNRTQQPYQCTGMDRASAMKMLRWGQAQSIKRGQVDTGYVWLHVTQGAATDEQATYTRAAVATPLHRHCGAADLLRLTLVLPALPQLHYLTPCNLPPQAAAQAVNHRSRERRHGGVCRGCCCSR